MQTIILENAISYYRKAYREHVGKCLVNDKLETIWIEIPKCASKSISHSLLANAWKDNNWLDNTILKKYNAVAIFRDPVKRWIGSTIELCFHHLEHNRYDFENFREWFDNQDFYNFDKNLDLHHLPQHVFLLDFPLDNIEIVNLGSRNFASKLHKSLKIQKLSNKNQTKTNIFKTEIEPFVIELLEKTDIEDKILDFYQRDIEFLNEMTDK